MALMQTKRSAMGHHDVADDDASECDYLTPFASVMIDVVMPSGVMTRWPDSMVKLAF